MKKKVQKDADELSAWVPPAYTVLKNKFPSLKKTFKTLTFCPRFIKHNYSCEICCIFVLLLLRDRGDGGEGRGAMVPHFLMRMNFFASDGTEP